MVSVFAVLFATATPAQRSLPQEERDEALKLLSGKCKEYYDLMAACARAHFPPERAQREIDAELGGLVILAHGNNAERGCQRQIEANRNQRVLDCEWK